MSKSEIPQNLIIYNPRSGKNSKRPSAESVFDAVTGALGEAEMIMTEYPGHARKIAIENAEAEKMIICGGDGTLNEVIEGLHEVCAKPLLAYIPMGSTNDFANNLKLPGSVDEAAKLLSDGNVVKCDLGKFNNKYFSYIASFGPGVAVSFSTLQAFKNLFGHAAYMINGFVFHFISTLRAVKPRHIRIEYDGKVLEDDFYFGTVSNTLSAAGMFKYDDDEVKLDDGKFEVTLIRRIKSPLQFTQILKGMHNHDYSGDIFMHFQASHLHLVFDEPETWTIDGESSGSVSEVTIDAMPREMSVIAQTSKLFLS